MTRREREVRRMGGIVHRHVFRREELLARLVMVVITRVLGMEKMNLERHPSIGCGNNSVAVVL